MTGPVTFVQRDKLVLYVRALAVVEHPDAQLPTQSRYLVYPVHRQSLYWPS